MGAWEHGMQGEAQSRMHAPGAFAFPPQPTMACRPPLAVPSRGGRGTGAQVPSCTLSATVVPSHRDTSPTASTT